ncbi:hypothetical protein N431DRAFT_525506 [Stipitochalara longipes BDJ]|nr:hypothetical protein N431DRAFT_525506 [Stipitochalara longipes BDJ]
MFRVLPSFRSSQLDIFLQKPPNSSLPEPLGSHTMSFGGGRMDLGRCRELQRAWRHSDASPETIEHMEIAAPSVKGFEKELEQLQIRDAGTDGDGQRRDLEMENAMLRNRIRHLEKQHNKDLEDLQKEHEFKEAMQASRIIYLERQLEKRQDAEKIIHMQQDDLDIAKTELEQSKKECEATAAALEEVEGRLEVFKKECVTKMASIEHMEPLCRIGIYIRRRFLEKAYKRAKTWTRIPPKHHLDSQEHCLLDGNDAAHQPDFVADLALYRVDNKDRTRIADLITAVYGYKVNTAACGEIMFEKQVMVDHSRLLQNWHNLIAKLRTIGTDVELMSSLDILGVREHHTIPLSKVYLEFLGMLKRGIYENTFAQEKLETMTDMVTQIAELVGRRPGA